MEAGVFSAARTGIVDAFAPMPTPLVISLVSIGSPIDQVGPKHLAPWDKGVYWVK